MQKQPRYRDACPHGIKNFISTINNKDVYSLDGTFNRTDGLCVRYGNEKNQCHDTIVGNFSQLIQNIYGEDE